MHPRQIRIMGILAAILVALVAVLVYVQPPEDRGEGDHRGPERVWSGLAASDVTRIEVDRPDGVERVFEREGEAWRIVEPFGAPADRWRVEDMASRLASLEAGEPIDAPDPAPFGLGETPRATVTFTDAKGEVRVLVLGDDAPVGSNTYVRTADGGPIRAAAGQVGADFLRPLDEYRSREPWKVQANAVGAVRWRSQDGGGTLKKDEHGWWGGETPVRADDSAVEALLREAGDLRIGAFGGVPEGTAFDRGSLVLVVDGAEHRIEIGAPQEAGVPARVPLAEGPVLLEDGVLALVDRDEADLALSAPLPVRRGALDAVRVTLGDLSLQDTRKDGLWQDEATQGLLDALEDARVDRGRTAVEPTAWGRIELTETGGRKEVLVIGPAGPDGACPARDEAGGSPFPIDAGTIQALRDALTSAA